MCGFLYYSHRVPGKTIVPLKLIIANTKINTNLITLLYKSDYNQHHNILEAVGKD